MMGITAPCVLVWGNWGFFLFMKNYFLNGMSLFLRYGRRNGEERQLKLSLFEKKAFIDRI